MSLTILDVYNFHKTVKFNNFFFCTGNQTQALALAEQVLCTELCPWPSHHFASLLPAQPTPNLRGWHELQKVCLLQAQQHGCLPFLAGA